MTTIIPKGAALRSIRQSAKSRGTVGVGHVVSMRAQEKVKSARRRAVTGQVRVVEKALGPSAANRYFWRAPWRSTTWFDVYRRMESLAREHPEWVGHFVTESAEKTSDAVTLAGLARHPFSRELLRDWLRQQYSEHSDALAARLISDRLLGGAFAACCRMLLEPDESVQIVGWTLDLYQVPDGRMFQMMDSVGWRPVNQSLNAEAFTPTVSADVRHRVVVAASFADTDAYSLLLPGAARTTLLATSETFGRADFSRFTEWPGVGDVVVEHIRSRVTRYSQEYVDLHEATAHLARVVCDRVVAIDGLLHPADVAVLEVEVADFLFFQALKRRAIEVLLRDETVDHVVIAVSDESARSEFISLIGGIDGLLDDPRVELVSTSRSLAARSRFWDVRDALRCPAPVLVGGRTAVPPALVLRKFDEDAQRIAELLSRFPKVDRSSVCLVTAYNVAYNDSTAAYAVELAESFDVQVMHIGPRPAYVASLLDEHDTERHLSPMTVLAPSADRFRPLADLLFDELVHLDLDETESQDDAHAAAAWALRSSLARLTRDSIAPALGRLRTVQRWLAALSESDELPDAFVLTPQRNASVGGIAGAARRFGIPTVILEPHAQDACYSRYLKIASDYYGVMSDYFKARAPEGFAIGAERVETVGSPRQVAPPDYDPDRAQQVARAEYQAEHGVVFDDDITYLVFFCQPSDWSHVAKLWSDVLEAGRRTGSTVLLKTHPEESVSRTAQYLDLAIALDAMDRVVLLDGDAARAIDLADIVITAYSAAGIDAALRKTPVVCVTVGDVRYPVDLQAIVDASLTRSADELADLVAAFQADPDPLLERARSLLEREAQFVTGPGPRARALVGRAIEAGRAGIREQSEVPASLFLDGPHPTFPV